MERTPGTLGVVAAVLVVVVIAARALGSIEAGPLYSTLKIALSVLFMALYFQVIRGRRSA